MSGISITIFDVTYKSQNDADRQLGFPANTVDYLIRRAGKNGTSIDQEVQRYQTGDARHDPKPITIFDVTYKSQSDADRQLGFPVGFVSQLIRRAGKNGTSIDHEVQQSLNRTRGYTYNSKHFKTIADLVKYVDNPFVTTRGVRRALWHGEHLGAYIKDCINRHRRLVVAGKQYSSVVDFCKEHGLGRTAINTMFRNGNSLQAIAEHLGLTEKIEKRSFMDGPVIGKVGRKGKPVRMSGWVWSSNEAFIAYYFGNHSSVRKELGKVESAAEVMLVHLCDLYRWKKLTVTNRLTPELEAQKPEWCHPINKDAREQPVNRIDILATPDWSGSPTHAYYEMREDSELIKTAKAMLAETQSFL